MMLFQEAKMLFTSKGFYIVSSLSVHFFIQHLPYVARVFFICVLILYNTHKCTRSLTNIKHAL